MAEVTQNLKNHARFDPAFHYIAAPIVLIHLVWMLRIAISDFNLKNAEAALFAFGVVVVAVVARTSALRAQNRTIRLEERMRYAALLPADVAARAGELPVGQIVALRFASDGELAGLVGKVLAGQLTKSKEIKEAIVKWRPDYCRV